ncbi:hypothetical protein D915_004421 [Fasciola hepatica]|uniref:Uncharacterized protein n=1 Tax=Fasciola hepatica TaxID=6192 RepID=A0A4E0RBT1_FASHE|nr:hypothetical protein D915_004421 [Fasciola hepatica]
MRGSSKPVPVLGVYLTLCVCTTLGAVIREKENLPKNPVILIPGDGGNRIYARPRDAPANQSAKLIWLDLRDFFALDLITEILSLHYDDQLISHDSDRYEITFPGWGDTETVSTLDSNELIFGRLYYDMVKDLKRDPYFVSNRSIRGAPYDFRRAPCKSVSCSVT